MNMLLKIVEGPNKGAEIALVEGVAVTFGKDENCDIVLADGSLPEKALSIEASSDGVTIDGEKLENYHVRTLGETSFAVGPAGTNWESLVWPKKEDAESAEEKAGEKPSPAETAATETPEPAKDEAKEKKNSSKGFGCFIALIIFLIIFFALGWFFRAQVKPFFSKACKAYDAHFGDGDARLQQTIHEPTIADIAAKYSLRLEETDGMTRLFGNLATRRERLAATAEAYALMPGIELDISDDESFRTAAEDSLFTLTEGALKVSSATNRHLTIVGHADSLNALRMTLASATADLPKLRTFDVSGVKLPGGKAVETASLDAPAEAQTADSPIVTPKREKPRTLPVCGILTSPYPCLVMKNGARMLEGATVGDAVIVKIEADCVTLTNQTGRFEWKP